MAKTERLASHVRYFRRQTRPLTMKGSELVFSFVMVFTFYGMSYFNFIHVVSIRTFFWLVTLYFSLSF